MAGHSVSCYVAALPLDGVANRAQNEAGPPIWTGPPSFVPGSLIAAGLCLLEPVASDAERSAQHPATGSDLANSWVDAVTAAWLAARAVRASPRLRRIAELVPCLRLDLGHHAAKRASRLRCFAHVGGEGRCL
jgi:hypothetical protein